MRPLAITGLGIVSAHGAGRASLEAALASPPDASAALWTAPSKILGPELAAARVAEHREFDASKFLGEKGLRNFDRLTKFMIVAGKLALEDAGVKKDGAFTGALAADEIGILSATAYGSLEAVTELNLVAEKEDPRYINPARFPNTVINAAAGYVSIWEDLRAPNVTIVDGNCGGLDAVLSAETHLLRRRGEAFLVGGGEVLSEPLYIALRKLGILAEGDANFAPGDPRSAGTRVGEAAAYVLVEREADARARGAKLDALITGYGAAFDVPESEALLVHASKKPVERAILAALADAGIAPSHVDVVLSSCSGVARFDEVELEAIEGVFGASVSVISPKAIFGETFGASGAVSLSVAASMLCARKARTIVATTMGYYGNVSAVVLCRA